MVWANQAPACISDDKLFVLTDLRAMWHGVFSQEMADLFVSRHLMNRSEFWTPTPLPSISVSSVTFDPQIPFGLLMICFLSPDFPWI